MNLILLIGAKLKEAQFAKLYENAGAIPAELKPGKAKTSREAGLPVPEKVPELVTVKGANGDERYIGFPVFDTKGWYTDKSVPQFADQGITISLTSAVGGGGKGSLEKTFKKEISDAQKAWNNFEAWCAAAHKLNLSDDLHLISVRD